MAVAQASIDTNVSEPGYDVVVEHDVAVPMRDGTILRADVYRPQPEGRYPVLIERVAYELTNRCRQKGEYYAPRGYVLVGQNVRGTYASQGQYSFFRDDAWGVRRDGYDTVEWAAAQPWSSGKVGMLDGSYSGATQYMVAPTRPPHLTALHVRAGLGNAYRDWFFRGGAHHLAAVRGWATESLVLAQLKHESAPSGTQAVRARVERALEETERWYRHLPVKSFPPLEGVAAWYFEGLAHPEDGPYWWPTNLTRVFDDVEVPAVHLAGWFDVFLDSTLRCFAGIRAHGRTAACREAQRLIVGPWIPGPAEVGSRHVGELDFGPEAAFDLNEHRLRWYDHWLKGLDNGVMDGPPVRIFLMGDNRWLDLETWPPADVTHRELYCRGGPGRTSDSLNNGRLEFKAPEGAEQPDSFTYDPDDPIPSLLTYPQLGPKDHRSVEGRMLTYTSDVLTQELAVVGPVKVVLYGRSSAPDTDWVARLCDVWPDGRSMSVCDGILRARFRASLQQAELMVPGQVYRFEVDLQATAQVFKAGHRLRLEVTGSDFPRYDRNLNTGGPFGEEVRGQPAVNTLFHDATRPSYVLLPVLPR